MFLHIGKQIKGIALFLCVIEILVSLGAAGCIAYMCIEVNASLQYTVGIPAAIIVGGLLIAWLSNMMLYSYGQLVDNSDRIARNTEILVKRSRGNY